MNKVWSQPKLIVLLRGKTEEAVLQHCKIGAAAPPPIGQPNDFKKACKLQHPIQPTYCYSCSTTSTT